MISKFHEMTVRRDSENKTMSMRAYHTYIKLLRRRSGYPPVIVCTTRACRGNFAELVVLATEHYDCNCECGHADPHFFLDSEFVFRAAYYEVVQRRSRS